MLRKKFQIERNEKMEDAINKFTGMAQFIYTKLNEAVGQYQEEEDQLKNSEDENLEMVESCKHSSIMLMNLINDLLDLAKQEQLTF